MAEGLDVGDHLAAVKHRNGAAQIGQVADRAFGEIGVVHQEHVARPHRLRRKVAHHGVRHRRIGSAGELSAIAVEQPDAIIMRLADHRRARGALDGEFDFRFDGIQRAFDDLQDDRIDIARARTGRGRPRPSLRLDVHRLVSSAVPTRRTIKIPCWSTSSCWPGNTTVVEPNSSITAGPAKRKPAGNVDRS